MPRYRLLFHQKSAKRLQLWVGVRYLLVQGKGTTHFIFWQVGRTSVNPVCWMLWRIAPLSVFLISLEWLNNWISMRSDPCSVWWICPVTDLHLLMKKNDNNGDNWLVNTAFVHFASNWQTLGRLTHTLANAKHWKESMSLWMLDMVKVGSFLLLLQKAH